MSFIVFLIIVATVLVMLVRKQPDRFTITRSALITAPADAIFPHINNLHQWEPWSPWAKLDPSAKNSFEGPVSGTGAIMHWNGNRKVGAGSMTIIDSRAGDFIRFRLEFLRPFKAINNAEFTFKPEGNQTLVTWSMTGQSNWIGKLMAVIMNCEKMVGDQFEQGLASLKTIAEMK